MIRRMLACGVIACAASCGGSDPSGPGAGTVEIADLVIAPTIASCRSNITGSNYTLVAEVHVINTTAEDVHVTGVSSNGQVIETDVPQDMGQSWHTYATIPYTPDAAVVRARDGDVKLRATMVVQCGVATVPNTATYKDVLTAIFVTTTAGQYTLPAVRIKVNSSPFGP